MWAVFQKKLMHTAALHKERMLEAYEYGWDLGDLNDPDKNNYEQDTLFQQFRWERMVKNVQTYIKSLNFGYTSTMAQIDVPYVNAMATFQDKNTLLFTNNKAVLNDYLKNDKVDTEKMGKVTAEYIVIATGGRPNLLDEKNCTGVTKYAITSDDIFSMKKPPNKTLVVGGGYIALECAGFLKTLGYPVTVMTRSDRFLRGFDMGSVNMLMQYMEQQMGMRIIPNNLPYHIEKKENGKLQVKWKNQMTKDVAEEEFDTVLMAIGRTANTSNLHLQKVGVGINPKTSKIIGGFNDEFEQTSVPNIFAIGDTLENTPELTPIAQKSATMLARRLDARRKGVLPTATGYRKLLMDYRDFPTTVFTPIEYSCCGLSEEQAINRFGVENIEVYHSRFVPLEDALEHKILPSGDPTLKKVYCKVICNKKDQERVVGFHYLGPNAGEVLQGYAVAMKMGMHKKDLDRTVGIHPTTSEEFVQLKKTKASGEDFDKTSC
jgi:thioredoxin reductase (NADPH)